MQDLKAELVRGLWYVALLGADVRPGRMVHKTLLGEPVLIGRGRDGRVFALRDICPHRGIPLHYGRFDGDTIACCYHGWRFDRSGGCIEIPSLRERQEVALAKIRCGTYPCVEQQGLVWIYFPRPDKAETEPARPPRMPVFSDDARPAAAVMQPFPCSTDHAAFGLMDPPPPPPRPRARRPQGPAPHQLRPTSVVVKPPAHDAAPEGKTVRADRARLA